MKSRILAILLAVVVAVFLAVGCTDKTKDNPTRPIVAEHGVPFLNPSSFYSIFFSTAHDPGYMPSLAYTPPGYSWSGGGGPRYPVLYLLAPFRSDERYYFEHGLAQVADRLLAEGKIEPMIIVSIDGRSLWGGSFFANSVAQGRYFTALVKDTAFDITLYVNPDNFTGPERGPKTLYSPGLVPRIDGTSMSTLPGYLTIAEPGARGISGVGCGGYGAFAAALKTDLFGSVSAINAPLDFDGANGDGGFAALLQDAKRTWWDSIVVTGTRVDTLFAFDTSLTDPMRSLIVSAAAAFSPHYTSVSVDSVYDDQFGSQTWAFKPVDSLTTDMSTYLRRHKVHVPIDSLGNVNSLIWQKWMDNNIENIYTNDPAAYASNFKDIKKLLVKSDQAEYRFGEQMDGFIAFLDDIGDTNHTVMEFTGNSRLTGTSDHFLYDILEDILIFHSQAFQEYLNPGKK